MYKLMKEVGEAMVIGASDRAAGVAALEAVLARFDAALESGEIRYDNQSFRALVDRKIAELQDS